MTHISSLWGLIYSMPDLDGPIGLIGIGAVLALIAPNVGGMMIASGTLIAVAIVLVS